MSTISDFLHHMEDEYFEKIERTFKETWEYLDIEAPPEIIEISEWFFGGFLKSQHGKECRFLAPEEILDGTIPPDNDFIFDVYELNQVTFPDSETQPTVIPLAIISGIEIILVLHPNIEDTAEVEDTEEANDSSAVYCLWNMADQSQIDKDSLFELLEYMYTTEEMSQ